MAAFRGKADEAEIDGHVKEIVAIRIALSEDAVIGVYAYLSIGTLQHPWLRACEDHLMDPIVLNLERRQSFHCHPASSHKPDQLCRRVGPHARITIDAAL